MCILLIFVVDVSLKSPLGTWNKCMYVCMYVCHGFIASKCIYTLIKHEASDSQELFSYGIVVYI